MNTIVKNRKKIFFTVGMLFVLCSIVEYIEFLFIRTDQTIIADNVKIGSNSVLVAPVELSEGANVAALSVITKNIS